MTNTILTYEEAKKRDLKCWYYSNEVYQYKDEDNYYHLMINGKDVLEGKKATYCRYHGKGDYGYRDKDGVWYRTTQNAEGGIEYKKIEDNLLTSLLNYGFLLYENKSCSRS